MEFLEDEYVKQLSQTYEIDNVHELIYSILPKGYNIPAAYAEVKGIVGYPVGTSITTFGYIDGYDEMPMKSNKITKIRAKIYKDGASMFAYWITAKHAVRKKIFALEQQSKNGALVQVSGKIKSYSFDNGGEFKFLDAPEVSNINVNNNQPTKGAPMFIVPEPLYVLKQQTKKHNISLTFKKLLDNWDKLDKSDWLPVELEQKLGLEPLYPSLQYVHGLRPLPSNNLNDFLNNPIHLKRIMSEKIWAVVNKGMRSQLLENNAEANVDLQDIELVKEALGKIPFELTTDQKRAIWQTMQDFSKAKNSKTLIFGDVGSGKTMVALILAYVALKNKKQVAFLTPTSILAQQHFNTAKKVFPDMNVYIVNSKTTQKTKNELNKKLSANEPMLIIGTSTINRLAYSNLEFVVVDEEQKFGVKDKEELDSKYKPHIIYMTATPIPRTLAGTMFSNFSVRKIIQKPAMQKPRITEVKRLQELSSLEFNRIKDALRNGQQMLVITPSIVSDEMMSIKQARAKYAYYFPEFKISAIHGNLKQNEIDKTTLEFMEGKSSILLATTMVDSGFSNDMLSFVFIESAERFGISQLHQIRGRVGRGSLQGYCYLSISDGYQMSEKSSSRLYGVAGTEDGFELSMRDIEIRGSGDLTGLSQSGGDVNFIEWIPEIEEMRQYILNKQKTTN